MARQVNLNLAIGLLLLQGSIDIALMFRMKERYEAVVEDQEERIKIYNEASKFLIDRADDETLIDLNKHMDFWRVIRGQEAIAKD